MNCLRALAMLLACANPLDYRRDLVVERAVDGYRAIEPREVSAATRTLAPL